VEDVPDAAVILSEAKDESCGSAAVFMIELIVRSANWKTVAVVNS